jgi:hypothetical protein
MTCPRCQTSLESSQIECPECGLRLRRNISGVMKTSAVLIAAGGEHGFYRSVQEVPEPLRTRLQETTSGANAGTILIADRAGRERLTEAYARREASVATAGPETGADAVRPDPHFPTLFLKWRGLKWAAVFLILALTVVIGAIFGVRW